MVLFNAVSADGRLDWLSPDLGQFYGLAGTWHEDATLVGSETVVAAMAGTPPEEGEAPPAQPAYPNDGRALLVVVDSRGRVRDWQAMLESGFWRSALALVSAATPAEYLNYLDRRRVPYFVSGRERVDLRAALAELHGRYDVKLVRVDSGGSLNGALLRAGLVDEVSLLVHPYLVGGTSPRSFFQAPDLTSAEGVIPLKLTHVERQDNGTLWLRYQVVR